MTDLLVAAFLYHCLDFIYRVKEEASGAEMAFVFYVLLSDGVFSTCTVLAVSGVVL
jgi:hypothetical protein